MARPEMLDRRPGWSGVLRLEPLLAEQVEALIGGQVSGDLRERIAYASGGNPLFVSEMLAMVAADDDVDVPPTLRALLTARLDQLDEHERKVLERGAVEGEIFHRGAVQALVPGEMQLTTRLAGLVRRELIRPDRAQLPGAVDHLCGEPLSRGGGPFGLCSTTWRPHRVDAGLGESRGVSRTRSTSRQLARRRAPIGDGASLRLDLLLWSVHRGRSKRAPIPALGQSPPARRCSSSAAARRSCPPRSCYAAQRGPRSSSNRIG